MDLLYWDSSTRDHWCATDWRDLQNRKEQSSLQTFSKFLSFLQLFFLAYLFFIAFSFLSGKSKYSMIRYVVADVHPQGEGEGYSNFFIHTQAQVIFFWGGGGQNFEFQYFWGFSEKIIFLVYGAFVDIFGFITKLDNT